MNRCVNTSDPRFKETAQRFNISEAKLEFIAHKYINAHEDKDFPDDAYIQEAIREKKYSVTKEQHDALIRAWEMMNPVISMEKFDSIQDIYAYIERLNWDKWVSYFPVNVTTTADGKYRATLSRPEFAIMGSPQKGKKPIVYNKEQEAAIQQAVAHIEAVRTGKSKQQFFTIRGKAGTGKTTIVNEILRRASLGNGWTMPRIVIGALSNKATMVIQHKIDDDVKKDYTVQFKSIAAMLAKRKDKFGNFTRDPKKVPPIKNATLVIIDEASMIGEEDYEMIKDTLKNSNTAVIFLGDSGQLPPIRMSAYYKRNKISGDKLSPIFAEKSIPEVSLVTRVRQGESSPVLDYADGYWEFSHELREEYPNDLDKTSKVTDDGALIIQRGEVDLVKQLLPLFKEAKETGNPNLVKIVPYTNNSRDNRESAVDRYNRLIRKALYPDASSDSFEKGDLVVFNDAYGEEERAIQNSTEGAIVEIRPMESSTPNIPGLGLEEVERIRATIKTDMGNLEVPVLVPSIKNRNAFNRNVYKLKQWAIETGGPAWGVYMRYRDTYAANLGYAYAIDSHKSQGSTYEVVAVDAVDINGVVGPSIKTKAQSIYTALTRASNVTIVSTNTTNENIIFTDIKGINDRIKSVKDGTATEETYTPKTVEEYFPEVTEEDIPDLIQDPNRKSKAKTKKKKMSDLGLEEDDLNDDRLRGTFNDNDDAKPKKWNAGPEEEEEDSDEDAKREVEKEEEESPDPQQKAYDRFVQVQSNANIKFFPKNHSYTVNGEKADYSVTTFKTFYLENEELEGDYKELSSRIGTSHDAVLRDFFAGEPAKEYPNLSLFQVKRLRKQAQRLKNRLESQYPGAMYITDEDLLRVAARVEYGGENYLVAGTMDMVLVTKEGNLVVVDFKTKRANSDGGKLSNATKEEYAIQTALYKAFVDVSSAAENEVLETLIAKFNVEYESPKKAIYTFKKDQILVEVDGEDVKIQEATDLYTPGIFDELLGFTAELDDITVSPVKTSLQRRKESKKVAEENRTTPKEFTGQMVKFYGDEKRKGIKAKSTLGAILEGKRTATTRFGPENDKYIKYWRKAKKGDIITFHDSYGNEVKVRVTVPMHQLSKDTDPEEWSKKEGWTVEHYNKEVKPSVKKGTAWQMEYELAEEKKAKQAPKKIEINSYNEKYALLSNLGDKPFEIDGKTFKSVEHYFGWCKAIAVEDFAIANRILKATTGKQAQYFHSHKLRMTKEQIKKWDSYSAKVMEKGMRAAFDQNEDAKDLLLSTGDALLTHKYGGPFADILMKLREEYGGSGRPESEKKARAEAKEAYAESKKVPSAKSSNSHFSESEGSYAQRTRENITWSDVTMTFAIDDETAGEKLTRNEAVKQKKFSEEMYPRGAEQLNIDDIPRRVRNFITGATGINADQSYGHKGKELPIKDIKLNIAGNGIYTLAKYDVSQEQINDYITEYIRELINQGVTIAEIRSGGQTGVDEAGIIAAQRLGIPWSVHAPKGWKFRDAKGKDISDKEAFMSRFVSSDQASEWTQRGVKRLKISTEGYQKGDPQKATDTAHIFTDNAQAYVTAQGQNDDWIEEGYNKGMQVKTGVSDVKGTNQAGIRASSSNTYGRTNINPNAFGIVVKKYQQKIGEDTFLTKEGQFQDTEEDFELFKSLNTDMFDRLENSDYDKIIFPSEMALGKAALPERFIEWLQEELKNRFGVSSTIQENTKKGYEGYGLVLNSIQEAKGKSDLYVEKKDSRYTPKSISDVSAFNTAAAELRKQGWHVEFYTKKSKDGEYTNDVMTISLEGGADRGFFELVKDVEDDNYSVHFKTKSKKADNISDFAEKALTDIQKENLFKALIFAIPEGAIISTWGQLTQGGVHALESLAERSGGVLSRYGERLLEDKDSNKISVPVYKKLTEDELIDKKLSAVRRARKEEKQEVKVNFSSPHFKVEKVDRDHEGYTGEFAITPEVVDLETLSSDVIEQEINDLLAALPYSSIISLDYLDVNDNFAYILDTLTRHPLVYATESDKQIKIDPHSSTGYMLSDYARTNRRLMWDAEKGILRMPVFTFGKTKSEIEERAQMNKLLNNPLLTQEELRHLSTAAVYKLSEIITHINTYKNGYDLYFGERQEGDKYYDTDFTQMSRIDIIRELGLNSLFDIVKERVFDSEKAGSSISRKTKKKMNVVHDNWKAFIKLGYDSLIGLEEIALNGDDKIKNELNDVADEEGSEDQDIVEELFGSSPEHWQVGFRQVSTFNSLSTMIKRVLYGMYQLAEDGDIVYSEFGLENRINPQEAVSKILHFTQGALSLDAKDENEKLYSHSMLAMLKEHLNEEPWLQQIIELLEGKYENGKLVKPADEQFKSQFYTNFQKYFQTYAVTVKDGKGNVNIKIINENAQADNIYNEVKAKENAFALGYFKMKNKDGSLNKENVKALREAAKKLDDILAEASGKGRKKMSDRGIDLDEYHAVIKEIADLLDIPVAEDSLYTVFNSKSNADKLSQKLFYLNEALKEDVKEVTKLREFKQIVEVMTKNTGMEMESVSYEAGKLYYSFVLPNYLSRLVNKLKQGGMSDTEYQRFLENEYLKYPWFMKKGKIRNHWLRRLSKSREARANLTHTTSLHFLGTSYIDKSPVEYIASMMRMYFYDNNGKWAYFRIPTLSNKPSEEYLKFERITTAYRDTITDLMLDVFLQELDRIQAVRKRQNNITKDQKIENFDTKGLEFVLESYLQKYLDGTYSERPEYEKLSQAEKQEEEKFSELLNKKLDGKMENDSKDYVDLMLLFKTMTKRGMDENYAIQRQQWVDEGFITLDKDGKIEKVFNDMKLSEDDLKEYFWNDAFATMQILELTITDPAYYKHGEDLQKRLAQLHSTGTQANIYARDNGGNLYTKDGIERTIYIKDNEVKSTSLKNLMKVADQILESTPENQKAKVRAQLQDIIKSFSKINWADAQGYSCPSSFRKKMGVFGKWGIREQQAYDMLMNKEKYPDASIADILDVLWQPIKPFVYSQISKPGYNDILPTLKVGVQNKNSEYTLMIADALMRRGGMTNKLQAIFDFMEESQHTGNELNGEGIDTIQFESTVKTGKCGVIDLNDTVDEEGNVVQLSAEEVKDRLRKAYTVEDNKIVYSQDYVHEIPFEDYMIQQEVPVHFKGHAQAQGSQNRILIFADQPNVDPVTGETNYLIIDGKKVSVEKAKKDYFDAIADNINESMQELIRKFKLEGYPIRATNVAISRILKEEILKDSRYGSDLLWACDTNELGEFNIPLSDPTQSNRIQQLLNSIIKNRINKQEIAGGPIVQVSSWGVSDQLNIRFKTQPDENNEYKLLLTETEFNHDIFPEDYATKFKSKDGYVDYDSYIADQYGVAYMEAYLPIQDESIVKDFLTKDAEGNEYIDVAKMEEVQPDLLYAVGYRIPTESKYSMAPIKIKGFLPVNSGEGIMLPAEITTMSGSDFDIDKMYIMRYTFIRKKGENGKIVYEKPTSGKGYRDNLIISTQLAVLQSKEVQKQLFTPGNFDEPKHLGYLVDYVQTMCDRYGFEPDEIYEEADKMDTMKLKDAISGTKNLVFAYTQVQFHKQNMVAGKLIGVFAQANVSHAFMSLVEDTPLYIPLDNSFTLNGYKVGGDTPFNIDSMYTLDGSALISSNLAALLAASVDAVKDPILNLININMDTVNTVTSLLRMGFNMSTVSLLCSQPIIKDVVREAAIRSANNEWGTNLYTVISEYIDKIAKDAVENAEYDVRDIKDIRISDQDLINNLNGKDTIANYMVLNIFLRMQEINDAFKDITHMTRYNSISSAVGPFASDTMLNRIKDKAFESNPLIGPEIKNACLDNPVLKAFKECANTVERRLLGANLIQAGTQYENALTRLGKVLGYDRGVPSKVANKFTDFFMSFYVNANPTGSVFDLSYEHRKDMLQNFPIEFLRLKPRYIDNALISSIQYEETDREQFGVLTLKTRGMSNEALENLKQAWVSLYDDPNTTNLAIRLAEYCFFRGSFGFNPKTFTSLIPNKIKDEGLFNYTTTLNKRASNVESGELNEQIILQFILHNDNLITDRFTGLDEFAPSPISHEEYGSCILCEFKSQKDENKTLSTKKPFLMIDNKAYYVVEKNTEGIVLKEVDLLGGDGQGFEISVEERFPTTVFDPDFRPTNQHARKEKRDDSKGGFLSKETVGILIDRLIDEDQLEGLYAKKAIDLINVALEERGFDFRIYASSKNKKLVGNVLEGIEGVDNPHEVLNKGEKTVEDLNLC